MLFNEYVDFLKDDRIQWGNVGDKRDILSAWRVEDSIKPLTTSITLEINTENCSPNEKAVIKEEVKKMFNEKYGVHNAYPKPRKVVYDETAGVTVVLWMDGTKTIVRAEEGTEHDAYHGYCAALAKKIHGTNSALQRELKKVLEVHNKKEEEDKTEISFSNVTESLHKTLDGLYNKFDDIYNELFEDEMSSAKKSKSTNVPNAEKKNRNNKFWSKLD